jgi:hypothetical protein
MICFIEHYSEVPDLPATCTIQTEDNLKEGDVVYIMKGHELTIESIIDTDTKVILIEGNKILRLKKH